MHAVIEGGELVGWTYSDMAGTRSTFIPDQVVHLKFWNPYHDVMGLSEWEGAMIAAESDYAGGVFARNLARNNGDRGPFVIARAGFSPTIRSNRYPRSSGPNANSVGAAISGRRSWPPTWT
jgi:hypothetical protein